MIRPIWRGRTTSGDWFFQWVLPGLFVIGGLVAEVVAFAGWASGTVWHMGNPEGGISGRLDALARNIEVGLGEVGPTTAGSRWGNCSC